MSDNENGAGGPIYGGPPAAGPEDPAQAALGMMAGLISAFAPKTPEQAVVQIAMGELGQQQELGAVLSDAVDPQKRVAHSLFGFKIRSLTTGEIVAGVEAPKDIATCRDLNELKHAVDVIAFATSPAARAVMRAYGYSIEFFQKKPESTIVAP